MEKDKKSSLLSPTHFSLMTPESFQAPAGRGDPERRHSSHPSPRAPSSSSSRDGDKEEEEEEQVTCEAFAAGNCEGPSKKRSRIASPEHDSYRENQKIPTSSKEMPPASKELPLYDLQYDNNYKYAAGKVAIATTKGHWDYQPDESGLEAFEQKVAARCLKVDKHLQFYNCVLNRPTREEVGVRELPIPLPHRETEQAKADGGALSAEENMLSDDSIVSNHEGDFVVNNLDDDSVINNFDEDSVVSNLDDDSVINNLDADSVGDSRDDNFVVNDLDDNSVVNLDDNNVVNIEDDCTVNNHDDNSAVVIDLTAATPPHDTASDHMLAQLLQQELSSAPSPAAAHVSFTSDFAIARQLQQELDAETRAYAAAAPPTPINHEEEEQELTYERLLELPDVKTGLSKQELQRLSITYNFAGSSSSSSAEPQRCSICLLELLQGERVRSLPCLHVFHSPCAEEWLKESKLCPVCMKNITELAS